MLWISSTNNTYPENNPGFKIWDWDKTNDPCLTINQEITPVGDRDAAINMNVRRTGGRGGNTLFLEYHIDAEHTTGHDIGMTSLVEADNQKGGSIFANWLVAAGPKDPACFGGVVGSEINVLNRQGDMGRKDRRQDYGPNDGCFSVMLQLVPENDLHVGDSGNEQAYNASFGLCFAHGHGTRDLPWTRTHVPICIEPGATAHNGICFLIGGSEPDNTEDDTPARVMQAKSTFEGGIDFFDAEFESGIALALRENHRIQLGYSSYLSGATGGVMLGGDHLYFADETRSLYRWGDAIWYRWMEGGEWKFQHVAGPALMGDTIGEMQLAMNELKPKDET